eukprot:744071_1
MEYTTNRPLSRLCLIDYINFDQLLSSIICFYPSYLSLHPAIHSHILCFQKHFSHILSNHTVDAYINESQTKNMDTIGAFLLSCIFAEFCYFLRIYCLFLLLVMWVKFLILVAQGLQTQKVLKYSSVSVVLGILFGISLYC